MDGVAGGPRAGTRGCCAPTGAPGASAPSARTPDLHGRGGGRLPDVHRLPDGRLLVVSSADRQVRRREADTSLVVHADLAPVSSEPWNDIVVDEGANAYVNSIGFDLPGEPPAPGIIALVRPDGEVRVVAEDATLTGRRVWAATPGHHPDGICLDASGAPWYADVGQQCCVRIREGGAVLDTVELDRGAFACALSSGVEPTLFVVAQRWGGMSAVGGASGQVLSLPAPSPGAGLP